MPIISVHRVNQIGDQKMFPELYWYIEDVGRDCSFIGEIKTRRFFDTKKSAKEQWRVRIFTIKGEREI